MNSTAFFSSLFYTIALLIMVVVSINITFIVLKRLHRGRMLKENELQHNNIALGIFYAGVIIAMTLMMRNSIASGMLLLQSNLYQETLLMSDMAATLSLICLQFFASFILSLGCIWIAGKIYDQLTHDIDETTEIMNNNIAISIVFVSVLIAVAIFVSPGVEMIVSSLAPSYAH